VLLPIEAMVTNQLDYPQGLSPNQGQVSVRLIWRRHSCFAHLPHPVLRVLSTVCHLPRTHILNTILPQFTQLILRRISGNLFIPPRFLAVEALLVLKY